MSEVAVLGERKRKPDPEVIAQLERMLAYAQSGELLGFVAFSFHAGNAVANAQAGDTDFSAILAAVEDWKFRRAWSRNRTDEP